ncbi:UDP-glycosyltransferase 79-like [Carex rostrata]
MLGAGLYPAYLEMVVAQFKWLNKADGVLVNSFYELEPEEAQYMESNWRGKTIGPTVPSSYLDNHLPSDTSYGFHLYTPTTTPCIAWLNSKPLALHGCISEVMEGERCEEYRRNAKKWREKAQEAMREDGSSYRNIVEFAAKYRAN